MHSVYRKMRSSMLVIQPKRSFDTWRDLNCKAHAQISIYKTLVLIKQKSHSRTHSESRTHKNFALNRSPLTDLSALVPEEVGLGRVLWQQPSGGGAGHQQHEAHDEAHEAHAEQHLSSSGGFTAHHWSREAAGIFRTKWTAAALSRVRTQRATLRVPHLPLPFSSRLGGVSHLRGICCVPLHQRRRNSHF